MTRGPGPERHPEMTMRRPLRHLGSILLAASLAATWGCSSSLHGPTAPMSAGVAPSDPLILELPDTTGTTLPGGLGGISPRDTVISVITAVSREQGTVLRAGCIELRVPAGAIDGDGVIELKARPNGRGVELHIHPESLNHFLIPLELRTDLNAMPPAARAQAGWFWVDESTGDWVLLESSTLDPETGVLRAPLQHFSKYEVGNRNLGKAGW